MDAQHVAKKQAIRDILSISDSSSSDDMENDKGHFQAKKPAPLPDHHDRFFMLLVVTIPSFIVTIIYRHTHHHTAS